VTGSATVRLPLVRATVAATKQAAVLMPGVVLENEALAAVRATRVSRNRTRNVAWIYLDDHGLVAEARRVRSPSGRPVFEVFKVRMRAR
jgi:hypothetical protein